MVSLRANHAGQSLNTNKDSIKPSKTMKKTNYLLSCLIGCGALLAAGQHIALGGEANDKTPPAGQRAVGAGATVTIVASVEAIDYATREVTLKGPRGNTATFTVDKAVKRLDEIKVGDHVRADYVLAVAAELRKPTPEEEKNPLTIIEGQGKTPAGTPPAAGALRHFKVVTTIDEIDQEKQNVTIKGPRGNKVTVHVADREKLGKVKKGEHVLITYTEAVGLSLEKAEKKDKE
jgi:hypothetical protein